MSVIIILSINTLVPNRPNINLKTYIRSPTAPMNIIILQKHFITNAIFEPQKFVGILVSEFEKLVITNLKKNTKRHYC